VLIVCGRTLVLCRTYRGLVSEENLRHSSKRIEKGTAKFREEARTSSNFLLLSLFSNQRFEGVKIPGPEEKHKQLCLENLVLRYQRYDLQILKRFFEGKHYSGFLDSRAFENIIEYFDSHITQNLKGTRFIFGKKATSLLITKDLKGTRFIGVGRDTILLFRTLTKTVFSANTRFF